MQGAGVLRCLLRVSPGKQPQEGQADQSQTLLHHERSGDTGSCTKEGDTAMSVQTPGRDRMQAGAGVLVDVGGPSQPSGLSLTAHLRLPIPAMLGPPT